MSEENKPRRGIATSEFWLSALTCLISLAVLAGWINPEGSTTLDKASTLAIAGLASIGYSVSRGLAKRGEAAKK